MPSFFGLWMLDSFKSCYSMLQHNKITTNQQFVNGSHPHHLSESDCLTYFLPYILTNFFNFFFTLKPLVCAVSVDWLWLISDHDFHSLWLSHFLHVWSTQAIHTRNTPALSLAGCGCRLEDGFTIKVARKYSQNVHKKLILGTLKQLLHYKFTWFHILLKKNFTIIDIIITKKSPLRGTY